jgi:hypothetical protein
VPRTFLAFPSHFSQKFSHSLALARTPSHSLTIPSHFPHTLFRTSSKLHSPTPTSNLRGRPDLTSPRVSTPVKRRRRPPPQRQQAANRKQKSSQRLSRGEARPHSDMNDSFHGIHIDPMRDDVMCVQIIGNPSFIEVPSSFGCCW